MDVLKVAIADDEPLARERLARMLADSNCEVVQEFVSGTSLLAWLREGHKLDALFLDIQMPGPSGLEVLAELTDAPPTIFVTAFSEHALKAFELEALDYLLKPVFPDRLQKSLARLRAKQVGRPNFQGLRALVTPPERVPLRAGDGHVFMDFKRISHFEVVDNEVFAWSAGKRHPTEWKALKEVEEALPDARMLRIQRHLLLRPEAVLAMKSLWGGRASVRVAEGVDLEVSRSSAPRLRALLGLDR